MRGLTIFLSLSLVVIKVNGECTEEELNDAQIKFKDCMDEKKASLLKTEISKEKVQDLICMGLKDLSTGCKDPVSMFALCRGREFVDNLVAIHLNAMSEVLGPLYPSVTLSQCPVFNTPAPQVVHVHHQDHGHQHQEVQQDPEPEYQPVTGGADILRISTLVLAMASVKLLVSL